MQSPKPKELLEKIANRYELRYLARTKRYAGIHRGLCMELHEFQGMITCYFFAPNAKISDQILDDFSGFERVAELGIPTPWFSGNLHPEIGNDPHGCVLELDRSRLKILSHEQFLNLPDTLVEDFRSLGAASAIAECTFCGTENPNQIVRIDGGLNPCCRDCLDSMQNQATDGVLPTDIDIRWGRTGIALVVGSLLFMLAWGLLQQPTAKGHSGCLLLMVPFFGAVCLCWVVGRAANGVTLPLRLITMIAVLLEILGGNIWGFRSEVMLQQFLTWPDAIELYFRWQLPMNGETESWFFLGGLAGAWAGFGMMKSIGALSYE